MVVKKRVAVIYLIMIFCFSLLIIRLGYIKIAYNEEYYNKAMDLWTRNIKSNVQRGNIYDRNNNLIVGSRITNSVFVIPSQVKDKTKTAKILANILNSDYNSILTEISKNTSIVQLKKDGRNISIEKATKIVELNLDGVYLITDSVRDYVYDDLLAPTIGIVGSDNQGITGLEYVYDSLIGVEKNILNLYTDAHGNSLLDFTTSYNKSTLSNNLYLTVDLAIQLSLERVLKEAVNKYDPEWILGIVMNPKTSEIYAIANLPSFDLENYQEYSQELYNRNLPIFMSYEPGSTWKFVTFSAGLEEEVFSLDETFYDPGYYVVDNVKIKDWKAGGHGKETYLNVIENSCNPGFINIGLRLGKDKLFSYIENYGFGKKTGVDLLGESSGIIFNKEKIGNVELATTSFGQGVSVTPIQLVNAFSAAINGGILHKPYIVKGVGQSFYEIIENKSVELSRVISSNTSKTLSTSLESVVARGTGRSAYIANARIGGKTGTAQVVKDGKYSDGEYILSFIGAGPMDDAEVVCYIAIKNAKNTIQYGGVVAAPLVKEVLIDCYSILDINLKYDGIEYNPRYYIDKRLFTVENYVGLDVKKINKYTNYEIIIEGNGTKVLAQLPDAGEKIIEGGYVILYT